MILQTLGLIFTLVVFGWIGWGFVRKVSRPADTLTVVIVCVVLFLAAIVGYGLAGPAVRLLDVFGFQVQLRWAVVALCLGGLLSLLACRREWRRRRGDTESRSVA